MATTLPPTHPFPGVGDYPLNAGGYDEAFARTGAPRPPYAALFDALAQSDLMALRERVRSRARALGLGFGPEREIAVDPVPRIIAASEWGPLEAGLAQRTRALNAFLADAYGEQRIFAAGIVPRRLLEDCRGFEPRMRGLLDQGVPAATVAGLDLVRDGHGELQVLEDNLRMPSGVAFAAAAREALAGELGAAHQPRQLPDHAQLLGAALRAAAPDGRGDPAIALLSGGPSSGTWYEHRRLAAELGVPVVLAGQLECVRGRLFTRKARRRLQLDVVYRRLDEERLSDPQGAPTPLGELLLPALESGRLRCVNAFGSGLADDKLTHAYADRMIRYYLREEPLLRSVPSLDLSDPEDRAAAMSRLDELVIKPREEFGGRGVAIMARATEAERRRALGLLRRAPERFVAQETIDLSTHPTVCGGRLRPRRVDLRPFAICGAQGVAAVSGALTRYARRAGEMIVNSSRGGGCKDTWVLESDGPER